MLLDTFRFRDIKDCKKDPNKTYHMIDVHGRHYPICSWCIEYECWLILFPYQQVANPTFITEGLEESVTSSSTSILFYLAVLQDPVGYTINRLDYTDYLEVIKDP